jgi:hypothetical protein
MFPSGSCCQPSTILVYPVPLCSLIICRAFARAASTAPENVSVIGGRFDPFAGKGGLSVVVLPKSLSTVPLDGDPCGATNFPSSAVLALRTSICLLPYSCFCMSFPIRSGGDAVATRFSTAPLNPNIFNWFREAENGAGSRPSEPRAQAQSWYPGRSFDNTQPSGARSSPHQQDSVPRKACACTAAESRGGRWPFRFC